MRTVLIFLIRIYQKTISPDHGILKFFIRPTCIFIPTCSAYAIEALQKKPLHQAIFLILNRLRRCHPWNTPGNDPVI